MTINILKQAKKFSVTKSFEEDTQLGPTIAKVNSYNSLLKDLPIASLTTSKNITHISNVLKRIFDYLRAKIRASTYPTQRTYSLIENLSKDLNNYHIEILSSLRLMNIDFEEFKKIYEELKSFFETWGKEYKLIRETITLMQKN